MLKEYTLKVTVRVGGETEDAIESSIQRFSEMMYAEHDATCEITHEEVLEVERD